MINIALNDLKIFIGDRMGLLLAFLLPIALISLFATIYGGMDQSYEERPRTILLADLDDSSESRNIVAALDSIKGINLIPMALEDAQYKVRHGDQTAVLVFHSGLGDSAQAGTQLPIEMQYDPSRELEMGMLQRALIGPLMNASMGGSMKDQVLDHVTTQYGNLPPEILSEITNQIADDFEDVSGRFAGTNGEQIKMTPLIPADRANWGLIQAVAGTAVMMLLFSVAAIGTGLLVEREEGTLKRLLVSPIPETHILFGKLLSTLIVSLMQLTLVFGFAGIVFKLDLSINLPALILMIISTAFACTSFGIFLAAISSSRKQVETLSTLVILVMSAIGGSMMPLPIMPVFMQKLAVTSVNFWSIQGFYDIFWRELSFIEILPRAGILCGIGTGLVLLSLYFYKKNIIKLV